jgi:hypothetical protein
VLPTAATMRLLQLEKVSAWHALKTGWITQVMIQQNDLVKICLSIWSAAKSRMQRSLSFTVPKADIAQG